MSSGAPDLPLDRIRDAQRVLSQSGLMRTPLLELQDGRPRPGRLLAKAENLLPTGSFKIRGATYRISTLTSEERQGGLVAYSTGNHAQAVAKAARDQGVDEIERVSEAEIADAVVVAASAMKILVEPGGAVGLAAALRAAEAKPGRHVAVIGGGNITLSRFCEIVGRVA